MNAGWGADGASAPERAFLRWKFRTTAGRGFGAGDAHDQVVAASPAAAR